MAKPNFEVFVSQNNPFASHRSNFNSQATQNFRKDQILYSHCGFQGHTIDKCFKLHGFPSRYKFNGPKNFTSAANQVYPSSDTDSKTPKSFDYSRKISVLANSFTIQSYLYAESFA